MQYVGQTLVFAVAQRSFDSSGNVFSTLVPLATLTGEKIEPRQFPNRGLVWWMVRGVADIMRSKPGRLVTAVLQESMLGISSDPDKDLYQVDFDTVQVAGPKRLIEVLTPSRHTSLLPTDILKAAVARMDHEPTTLVLVRIGAKIYGPFKGEAEEDPSQPGRFNVQFGKASVDRPIYEIDERTLPVMKLTADVSQEAIPPSRGIAIQNCSYELALWGDFEAAQAKASIVRLSTDEEVISRVAKVVMSRPKRQELIRQFREMAAIGPAALTEVSKDDLGRVEEIALGINQSVDGVDGLIKAILDGGFLADEVKKAIEATAARSVADRVSSLRAEAEIQVHEVRKLLEDRTKELAELESALERRRRIDVAELDAFLEERKRATDEAIQAKQEALHRQEVDLAAQRKAIEVNLSSVVHRFREEKDRIITDFLAISPILESTGILGNWNSGTALHQHEEVPKPIETPRTLSLPAIFASEPARSKPPTEVEFFERFSRHAADCGFTFQRDDLISFHVAVKCSDLSVMGGMSGTGKSSLPRLYAQALAGDQQDLTRRFLPVDVSPAWTSPSDLLGYVNLLDRSFHPGSSGLFTHVAWAALEAQAKGGDSGLYLVCLDEMNLAHVEHYFSGFIQALSRAQGSREVAVFDPASISPADAAHAWHRLPLNDNIRFIGTVNFDETTKPISQRVLDRADMVRLQPGPLLAGEGKVSTSAAKASGTPVVVNDIRGWINERPLEPGAAQLLEALQPHLSKLGCPLTPRRLGAIARFISSTPRSLCSPELALDMQVAQRILPQVKGLFRQEARTALTKVAELLSRREAVFARSLSLLQEMQASEEVFDPATWAGD